ncbi:hypothetical protein J4G48_0014820 [Bradyrhizobium barranii subsp. apii]|uniref:hypothetical protein n=1 Tax=Bradyrhizobium barranii TaxID=2992140 RepID=UPI00206253C6|nr:hypothetical protein [Bradyrhizobium barranii]UPU01334.1 hypothetical protein J4G48_0014820 [Bradyrhizobium barranii subsp. apii]
MVGDGQARRRDGRLILLRRERKEQKKQRLAMKRYVAQRMEEDIETCIEIVKRKAARIRKARNKAKAAKKQNTQ